LLQVLEAEGRAVRCIARKPEHLRARVAPTTTVVTGDCLDPASLRGTLDGARVAFYLVHSMGSSGDFARQDVEAARHFAAEARRAGVTRIIYLGGLGDESAALSKHLRSRHDTGAALRAGGCR
jgi:uncharacterized protein YbjT (DUF2867 family)